MRGKSESFFTLVALLISLALPVLPARAVSANPTTSCSAGTCTVTFTYSGDYYLWSVPVSGSYLLETWGAQGGNAGENGTIYSYGGSGGYASGSVTLAANQNLYIYVGGQGSGGASSTNGELQTGGFNGGGAGYNGDSSIKRGGGGGGATDIRLAGNSLSNRIIVAGGGAGGLRYDGYLTNHPGVGGGSVGADGYTDWLSAASGNNGRGGTQSQGGAGGINGGTAQSGSLGLGGNSVVTTTFPAAGGGGGYYGGGGSGVGAAGGGGSGYIGTLSSTSLLAGNTSMPNPSGGTMTGRSGSGIARITYSQIVDSTTSLSIAGSVTSMQKNIPVLLTAFTSTPGTVTFYANEKRIPRCISIAATDSATCSFKSSLMGSQRLTATLKPTNQSINPSTSLTLNISVIRRINPR